MNQNRIIKKGSQFLKNKNIGSYLLDTEIILSDLLGISREKLILRDKFELSKKEILKFKESITRRAKYEPIAYIVKKKVTFFKYRQNDFICNYDYYILSNLLSSNLILFILLLRSRLLLFLFLSFEKTLIEFDNI